MEFESVEQAAKRLQVTPRAIQKWAKEGKIPGANRVGRTWLIPMDFMGTDGKEKADRADESAQVLAYPLQDMIFTPGHCLERVMSFPDGVQRDVMTFQYDYFCGRSEQAAELAARYLEHKNLSVAMTASVMYSFANLGLGKAHLFQQGQEYIQKYTQMYMMDTQNLQARAYAVYITTMVHVLLHLQCPPMPALESEIKHLPMGTKLHAGYIMAYEAYLEKDYGRCLGIAEMALAMCGDTYVIPAIYLHLIASIALMSQRRIVEAKSQFEQAWQLACADDLVAVFGEHMGVLQGLLEVGMKKQYPEKYKDVMTTAARFVEGWRKVHNDGAKHTITSQLTVVEMAVASLFYRGWAVKEIAAYMEISPRMVCHHISVVYEKLGISHREGLAQYMV